MKLKINVFKKNKGKKIDPDMTCTSLDSPRLAVTLLRTSPIKTKD